MPIPPVSGSGASGSNSKINMLNDLKTMQNEANDVNTLMENDPKDARIGGLLQDLAKKMQQFRNNYFDSFSPTQKEAFADAQKSVQAVAGSIEKTTLEGMAAIMASLNTLQGQLST